MLRVRLRSVRPLLVLALLVPSALAERPARADAGEEDPQDAGGAARRQGGSRFTFAFAGGAMIPRGEMKTSADGGLDVASRFGWTASNGLGFVVNVEYALFRRGDGEPGPLAEDSDASLFAATAAPRFTLGKQTVQVWFSAGGGVIMERIRPAGVTVGGADPALQTTPALSGTGGLDFNLFGAAGLSLAGGYTRSFSDGVDHDYFSINAGLVFSI